MPRMLRSAAQTAWLARQQTGRQQERMDLLNPPAPELPEGVAAGMQGLASAYSRSYGQARQANEARYNQMLKIADRERTRGLELNRRQLEIAGRTTGQRAADIRSEGMGEQANIMQRLTRQGMAGSTVGSTLRAGVRRGTQSSLNRLADTMQQTKLGLLGQRAGMTRGGRLGIMEGRTDAYPDPSALTGAFGAVGEGYGGSGMEAMMSALTKMQRRN